MEWKRCSAALLVAGLVAASAHAGPGSANLWIGLGASDDGFLIDPATGDLWMTGICLKPLENAEKTGLIWTSRTFGMVSVGRAMTMLDQTFILDTNPIQPTIAVNNPSRGGLQTLPAVITSDCGGDAACAARRLQPICED